MKIDVMSEISALSDKALRFADTELKTLRKNADALRSDFNNKVVSLTRKYGISLEPRGFRFGVEKATLQEEGIYYKARNYEPLPFAVNGTSEETFNALVAFKHEKHLEILERFGLPSDTRYHDPIKFKYSASDVYYKENLESYTPYIMNKMF